MLYAICKAIIDLSFLIIVGLPNMLGFQSVNAAGLMNRYASTISVIVDDTAPTTGQVCVSIFNIQLPSSFYELHFIMVRDLSLFIIYQNLPYGLYLYLVNNLLFVNTSVIIC